MLLYHAGSEAVELPEIRITKYTKDFSWGFYCPRDLGQAKKWALRNRNSPTVNRYLYTENPELKVLSFHEMTDEWLDFIVHCRRGGAHDYDIVEGAMADDAIWDYVEDFIDGSITREAFWVLIKFKQPTHQISFHTLRALCCLNFEGSDLIAE